MSDCKIHPEECETQDAEGKSVCAWCRDLALLDGMMKSGREVMVAYERLQTDLWKLPPRLQIVLLKALMNLETALQAAGNDP